MTYDRIRGTILGGWWIDCAYTDGRWRWLGKLLFVSDGIVATAGSKEITRAKYAPIAATSEGTSCPEQRDRSGTSASTDSRGDHG